MYCSLFSCPAVPGQRARRVYMSVSHEPQDRADRLAAMAAGKERLTVRASYVPAERSYQDDTWDFALEATDGTLLAKLNPGPPLGLARDVLPRSRWVPSQDQTIKPEPEVVEAAIARLARDLRVTVVGAFLEPPRRSLFASDSPTRDGLILLEIDGPAAEPWRRPTRAELPRGTRLVYWHGKIVGQAAKEGGAERAARSKSLYAPAKNGWRLKETDVGTFWMERPAEDAAHALRQMRIKLAEVRDQLAEVKRQPLGDAPDLARDVAEQLSALAVEAETVCMIAGVPTPRRARTQRT